MRSAAGEIEERHDGALVGATQRAQIRLPDGTSVHESITSAPCECLLPESHDERVSSETGMPPVPVREGVHGYEAVMEANRDLVWRHRVDLGIHVSDRLLDADPDMGPRHADVGVSHAI